MKIFDFASNFSGDDSKTHYDNNLYKGILSLLTIDEGVPVVLFWILMVSQVVNKSFFFVVWNSAFPWVTHIDAAVGCQPFRA